MKKFDEKKFDKLKVKVDKFFTNKILFYSMADDILRDCPEPQNLDDMKDLIHACISSYWELLFKSLKSKPFTDLYDIISELQKEDDINLEAPVREILKSFKYDEVFGLLRQVGAQTPSNSYINKLKSGDLFRARFNRIVKNLRAFEPSIDSVVRFLGSSTDITKVTLKEFSEIQALVHFYGLFLKIAESIYDGDELKRDVLSENKDDFLVTITKICLIFDFMRSEGYDKVVDSLLFFTNLVAFDLAQLNELFFTSGYTEFIQKMFSSKNRKKGWSELEKQYQRAISIIDKKWDDGDTRWHYELVAEVVDEINEEIKDKILSELLAKYPSKLTNKDQQKQFEKEKEKRFNYETLSVGTLNKKIKEKAIERGRYYDPGAKYREENDL